MADLEDTSNIWVSQMLPPRMLSTNDLSDDDLIALREMIIQFRAAADYSAPDQKPTSELFNKAARMINDLMIGRGVDRRNGFQWQAFVRELYDRAEAFKAVEDRGRNDRYRIP